MYLFCNKNAQQKKDQWHTPAKHLKFDVFKSQSSNFLVSKVLSIYWEHSECLDTKKKKKKSQGPYLGIMNLVS